MECSKSKNGEHCWHTGSLADSAGITVNGSGVVSSSITHYKCCWCGDKYTKTTNYHTPGIEHGEHSWSDEWPVITSTPYKYPSVPFTIERTIPAPANQLFNEPCMIEEFFKKNPGTTSASIACFCPKCRIYC